MPNPMLLGLAIGPVIRGKPPKVDRERPHDTWARARRREWAAAHVEDTLRRGRRVLVTMADDTGARYVVHATAGMVVHWCDGRTTEAPPVYLISEQLATYLVTKYRPDHLLLEGPDAAWHPLPMTPGRGRVDHHAV